MKINIEVKNGNLSMKPKGENLTKAKVLKTLATAYCNACNQYGLSMVDCDNILMPIMRDAYFDKEAINKVIETICKE